VRGAVRNGRPYRDQRRGSSRRLPGSVKRSTIYSPRHAEPVLPSRDFPRCSWQSFSIRVRPGPSDRTTRLAKTSHRCGREGESLPLPTTPSEIAAAGVAQPSAKVASACDSTGSPKPPGHSDRAGHHDGVTPPPLRKQLPGRDTSGPFWRCRGSGPSRRTPRRSLVYREAGILPAAGCHGDGRSQRATFLRDGDGADGGEILT